VKIAAAVLGAALLFFLGVLTGTGRHESVPPPVAIPLGVVDQSASDAAPESPSSGDDRGGGGRTTPTTAPPATSSTTTGSSTPSGSRESTATTAPPPPPTASTMPAPSTSTTAPATTSTTAPPGQVEEVDSEVDCSRGRGKGKGGRQPCETATTERDEGRSGGGGDR
jgi:hypothetical protein